MNIDTPEKIRICMVHDDHRRYVKMVYRDITVKQRIGLEVFRMPRERMERTIMGLAKQAKVQMVRECVRRKYPVPQEMEVVENGEIEPKQDVGHVEIPGDESGPGPD